MNVKVVLKQSQNLCHAKIQNTKYKNTSDVLKNVYFWHVLIYVGYSLFLYVFLDWAIRENLGF